jgi:natural product biosynthesis luciferase-like monooxygenase protein
MITADAILRDLANREIEVRVDSGRLRVRAARGVLDADTCALIETHRTALIAHLENAPAPRASAMSFSLFFFASEDGEAAPGKYDLMLEAARYADRAGFAAISIPERHYHPMGGLFPCPAIAAAAVATVTERLRLRAGSVVLPLHDPLEVAEQWAMVDNLSGGRVELSFASGWHANDFVLAPERYASRKDYLLREIDTVRRLWRGEAVRRRGGGGSEVEVRIRPLPLQPELPVWLTAIGNPESYREAGARGANLLTCLLTQDVDELAAKLRLYREAREAAGYDPKSGRVSLFIHTFVDVDPLAARERVREPFTRYLESTMDLIGTLSSGLGSELDPSALSSADRETLLAYAFDRYVERRTLIGSVESCAHTVETLARAGVDDLACLIDFGVDERAVLEGLGRLSRLRSLFASPPGERGGADSTQAPPDEVQP